jgi:hypothetical protein
MRGSRTVKRSNTWLAAQMIAERININRYPSTPASTTTQQRCDNPNLALALARLVAIILRTGMTAGAAVSELDQTAGANSPSRACHALHESFCLFDHAIYVL